MLLQDVSSTCVCTKPHNSTQFTVPGTAKCFSTCLHVLLPDVSTITRCFYHYQMFLPLPDVSTITKCFSPCLHVLLPDVSTFTRCFPTCLHVLFPNISTITRCFSICLHVLLPDGTCTMYTCWLHGIQLVSIPHSWRPMIHENGVYIYCTCVVPGGNIHCPKNSLQHSEVQL